MPTFDPYASPVDYVLLGGQRSPGIADIVDADRLRRLHERRGFALSGATVRDQGAQLVHFKVRLRFYTSDDFDLYDTWRQLLDRPPGRSTNALDFSHPITDLVGITSVIPERIGQPVQTADGEWTVEIGFCEYRNPQPALDAVQGSDAVRRSGNGTIEQQIENTTRALHDEAQLDSFAGVP